MDERSPTNSVGKLDRHVLQPGAAQRALTSHPGRCPVRSAAGVRERQAAGSARFYWSLPSISDLLAGKAIARLRPACWYVERLEVGLLSHD